MDITFRNTKLRKLCEQQAVAHKALGKECARALRSRLADLDAAMSVQNLIAGKPHPLKGDRQGQFALRLKGGTRLVLESANDPVPCKEDDSIDWSKVSAVCIVFIGDYHD